MKIRSGFTLVETMVVLIISTMILSLTLLVTHHFNVSHFQNYFFWKEFHGEFQRYESLAVEHHSQVMVMFHPHRQVDFRSRDPKIHPHIIKEPRDLSPKQLYRVKIYENGHVDPTSLIWLINDQLRLTQKFQLGWGMYEIENYS